MNSNLRETSSSSSASSSSTAVPDVVGNRPGDGKIIELRELLRERFPEAHGAGAGRRAGGGDAVAWLRTGVACLDASGVLPGMVVEVTAGRPSVGGALAVAVLLETAVADGRFTALVDGADGFDPAGISAEAQTRLLWVRCAGVMQAIRAADLLLRDGNLPVVVLDLQLNAAREVRRVPGSAWFRLAGLAERTDCVLAALTPCAVVASAHLRVALEAAFHAEAMDQLTGELAARLAGRVVRHRRMKAGAASDAMHAQSAPQPPAARTA